MDTDKGIYMELFTKQEKGKEILSENSVLLHFKSNGKFDVLIEKDTIKVTPRGVLNAMSIGLVGEKVYSVNNISGVQLKTPGLTTGYLQIILIGGRDARGGVMGAVKDENSITFGKKELPLAEELKEYIEWCIQNNSAKSSAPAVSNLDEIKKLKELLDIGAITQEEFDAKKAQLLNL